MINWFKRLVSGPQSHAQIPKQIHQIWNDEHIPGPFRRFAASWLEKNPGWSYRLWTMEAGRSFIRELYPELLSTFDSYPKQVQRADLLRYLVLAEYGGVYADLDVECLRSFDRLIQEGDFIIGFEDKPYASLCNAVIASAPWHPIWVAMIRFLRRAGPDRSENTDRNVSHVFATTGSLVLTPIVLTHATSRTKLLPKEFFYPFSWAELEKAGQEFPGSYTKHFWNSGWYGKEYVLKPWIGYGG